MSIANASDTPSTQDPEQAGLKRVLSFSDVLAYGLLYFVPIAPVSVFGLIYNTSAGMVALVYLVAAVAMIFSAISYSQMARKIPLAGSVYSYVTHGTNSSLGFVAGWAILLDYLLLPALLAVLGTAALSAQFPQVPTTVWLVTFVAVPTAVNLMGIEMNARLSKVLLLIQLVVLFLFAAFATSRIIELKPTLEHFIAPFYNRSDFSMAMVFAAVPIAALSYIGFDAVSTLNEEAKGGGETVSRATMMLLMLVTVLFVGQVYLAAVFVPLGTVYQGAAADTAFYTLSAEIVGAWFLPVITLTSGIIALMANTLVSQATTARVLFSMSRDKRLPAYLSRISARTNVPANAIVTVALVSFVVAFAGAGYLDVMVTLVTFGALTAYILLHVSVMIYFRKIGQAQLFSHGVSPVLGVLLLSYALWSTNVHAKVLGAAWMLGGLLIAWVMRRRGAPSLTWTD